MSGTEAQSEALRLPISLGERSYNIVIGEGLLGNAAEHVVPLLKSQKAIVVADAALVEGYAEPLLTSLRAANVQCELLTLKGGEESKSFSVFEQLLNEIMAHRPDRRTTLIALGGGVIGDSVGFAASVILRGVPFIQIPTTLLAQIDSSVGGKTGINSAYGKNTIGAFYQPEGVLIDTQTLASLLEREMKAGYAEMVKYALLGDAELMGWLEAHGEAVLAREPKTLAEAIEKCCAMKAAIVAEDEREAGKRALLNLGHTFGHALEAEAGYDGSLLHGEAVGIGLVMAAKLSQKLGCLTAEEVFRIEDHMKGLGLKTSPRHCEEGAIASDEAISFSQRQEIAASPTAPRDDSEYIDALMRHMSNDKKARDGKLVLVLMKALGEAYIEAAADAAQVRQLWEEELV